MHPIEWLRYVARADGAAPSALVSEAAGALAAVADDPAALVTGSRRLVDRHPTVGPMWWLAARVLSSVEPGVEAWAAATEVEEDPTPECLAAVMPDNARVVLVGWPELAPAALVRRGDVSVQVVEDDESRGLARRLRSRKVQAREVPQRAVGAAVADADLVILEAEAFGSDSAIAASGSLGAAAVAYVEQVPCWLVAGVGRALPTRLWEVLLGRLDAAGGDPWESGVDRVSMALFNSVVGPEGLAEASEAMGREDCVVAPELLRGQGLSFGR